MKKLFLFLTFAVITAFSLFSLTSCGDDDNEGISISVSGLIGAWSAHSSDDEPGEFQYYKFNKDGTFIEVTNDDDAIEGYIIQYGKWSIVKDKIVLEYTSGILSGSAWAAEIIKVEKNKISVMMWGYIGYLERISEDVINPYLGNIPSEEHPSSGSGKDNGHLYVNLGLPSGTQWATCNIGASKPEEYGGYYAWGEIATKSEYYWSTYKYGNDYDELTKYCTNSNYGLNGFTDGKTELELDDDVAHKQWGGQWRMPSVEQFEELLSNTTSQWVTVNGKEGRLFTASNGNSIFLPAAGRRYDTSLSDAGSFGDYWSRTLRAGPYNAYGLYFNSGGVYVAYVNDYFRYYGHTVRPVRP